MIVNKFFGAAGRLPYNVSAFNLLSRASRQSLLTPPYATFAASPRKAYEDAEEVEIIDGSKPGRTSESEFQNWLKKDLKTSSAKVVDWKR